MLLLLPSICLLVLETPTVKILPTKSPLNKISRCPIKNMLQNDQQQQQRQSATY
jgi:hypothetical protein